MCSTSRFREASRLVGGQSATLQKCPEGGFMNFDLTAMTQTVITLLTTVGLKLLGAIAIWIVGRWLLNFALLLIGGALTKHKLDPTLTRYIHSAIAALLNIVLVVAILGFFGV